MKKIFENILVIFVCICIFVAFLILGFLLYKEIGKMEVDIQPEEFKSVIDTSKKETTEAIQTPEIIKNDIGQTGNTNAQTTNVNYDNISVDKYYYNQLDNYSKTMYKAFEGNKEAMKTGTARIDFENQFSDIASTDQGQEKLGKYYGAAINAYTYDNPDIFYINPNKLYLNIETVSSSKGKTYNIYVDNGNEANYYTNGYKSKSDVENAISKVEEVKKAILSERKGDTYTDIKMIHDYLINTIEYDSTLSKDNIYNIYGALVNHECVCEGYARSMKYLLDNLGIPCVLVIGTGTNSNGETENHAWDYVELNNNWYAIDATWDDPIVVGGGQASNSDKYRYFLKGSTDMNKNHTPNGQFAEGGKVFSYPNLSSKNY